MTEFATKAIRGQLERTQYREHSKLTEAERLAVEITSGLVRISVGLEAIADIIADLQQALEK